MKVLVLSILLFSFTAHSLEVDEKLTIRMLRVSSTKKTILVNRGLEDGLAEGDHAKLFLTTGVFARGVVVKVSPTRSIWSLYRISSPEQIVLDKLANIKITKAVTLTDDPSKSFALESTKSGVDRLSIPLAPGANDLPNEEIDQSDKEEISALESDKVVQKDFDDLHSTIEDNSIKTLEIWTMASFNNLSASYDNPNSSTGVTSVNGSSSSVGLSLGAEKYFRSGFLRPFSIDGFFHHSQANSTGSSGDEIKSSVNEFGVGGSWHFYNSLRPHNNFIGYLRGSAAMGSASASSTTYNETDKEFVSSSVSGSSTSFSFGIGGKYYTRSGFGARAIIDYYSRSEGYNEEVTKTVSGPRFIIGLSYLW